MGFIMKKKRAIIIENPCLRKIRNNFRSLILKSSRSIQHRILDEIEELKNNPDYYEKNNDLLLNQAEVLYKKENMIESALRSSILLCPACLKTDKDMIYNPVRKTWYCIECYKTLRDGFAEEGDPEEFP